MRLTATSRLVLLWRFLMPYSNRLNHQARSLLRAMVNISDGEYYCQCAKCGTTMDVTVIAGRPRHARVSTNGVALIHRGNGVAECFGRLRVFGAGS
jgi:hypothetical protein